MLNKKYRWKSAEDYHNNGDWKNPKVRKRFAKKRNQERNEWDNAYDPSMAAAKERVRGDSYIKLHKYQFSALRWALVRKAFKEGAVAATRTKHALATTSAWCDEMLIFLYSWEDDYKKLGKTINGKNHWFYCSIKAMEGLEGKKLGLGLSARMQQYYLKELRDLKLVDVESISNKNTMLKIRYIRIDYIAIDRMYRNYKKAIMDKDKMDAMRQTGLW